MLIFFKIIALNFKHLFQQVLIGWSTSKIPLLIYCEVVPVYFFNILYVLKSNPWDEFSI